MRSRLFCFVNGILTFPGESKNWTGRAVTWTQIHTEAKAEKVEYWAGPIDRVIGQRARAEKLYRTLTFYCGWEIVLVGHSNGADVICDMIRAFRCPPIDHVHLVSGAAEANFAKNGLNSALQSGRVAGVTVYCGAKDWPLRVAHTLAGHILGYGTVGLSGPVGVVASVADRVRHVVWPEYGHSDCWADENFDGTMEGFVGGAR